MNPTGKREVKTWKQVVNIITLNKDVQRAALVNDYKNPIKIYYDSILQKYVVEVPLI